MLVIGYIYMLVVLELFELQMFSTQLFHYNCL